MTQHYLLNIIIKKKNERTNRIEIFFHCFVLLVLLRYNIVFLFLDLLFRSLDVVRIAIKWSSLTSLLRVVPSVCMLETQIVINFQKYFIGSFFVLVFSFFV